jgi:superfamily I DNA/RNA helicase
VWLQSIMSFANAARNIFGDFKRQFKPKIVYLVENYR